MSLTVPVAPAQLINGPTVIITGPALLEISALLQLGIKHLKVRDAIAPPPRLLAIADLVKQAADQYRAMSDVGPRPQTSEPDPASSSQTRTRSQQVKPLRCSASPTGTSGGSLHSWASCESSH